MLDWVGRFSVYRHSKFQVTAIKKKNKNKKMHFWREKVPEISRLLPDVVFSLPAVKMLKGNLPADWLRYCKPRLGGLTLPLPRPGPAHRAHRQEATVLGRLQRHVRQLGLGHRHAQLAGMTNNFNRDNAFLFLVQELRRKKNKQLKVIESCSEKTAVL